ncbi:Thioredoxin-like fold domain-containing protein [Rozella allomycis CSF55]|uniref:Monothiol glutaredoxin-5, mitochondrial n=1 Tax=Rozella allomycis (strain CSF55) TaxID=988480 RepID=A0A075B0G6_ROZAC|nr:Thioredoxin-like fold domain-containing protein [Rozella allomycis CSF55]|eukprot:EPZ34449.1 Thioredoxin-like fold domain-containing protein [Rozella allomycis CSF55]
MQRLNILRTYSRLFSTSIQDKIKQTVQQNDIVVFMKGTVDRPMCGFSRAACQILYMNGVPRITGVNVLASDDFRQGVKEFTKWPTIPQIFVKGEFVGGADIILEMHQSGQLKSYLKDKGIQLEETDKDVLEPPKEQ